MRIHHLRIEAIGPFPGRHDVNFDELSSGGLFLLEGPTGAGKSTLIDAITYGFYGTLGTAENTRLPSNHAPLVEPLIEVVFSTNAGIFRARRTPPHTRPRRRGDGFTTQNATAKLWRLSSVDDGEGEPVAASTQEVGTEMRRILGLTREQFMQTVVLPQGRFSTFLRAKPDERAAVLRDVFGTAIYQQVQDQLAEMARDAKRQVTTAQGEVSSAVRSFANLLPEATPATAQLFDAGAALDADEMTRITGDVVTGMRRSCEIADDALQAGQAEEVRARSVLETQKELQRNLARRTSLLVEHRALMAHADAIAADRDRLAIAQRAATAAGALRGHEAATETMARAEQGVASACSQLQASKDEDLAAVAGLPALRGIIDAVSGERGGLSEAVPLEAGLPARVRQLADADAALARSQLALETEREELAARPGTRAGLTAELDTRRRTATPVAAAHQAALQRRAIRDAARRTEELAVELAQARETLTQAGVEARAASEDESAVRLRWIDSTAGSLAATLEAGVPCPVCGGTEHPNPAPELPGHANLDDVEAATQGYQKKAAALQEAEASCIRTAERLAAQQEAAQHTHLADAEDALARAETDVAAAKKGGWLIEESERAMVDFDAETGALTARVGVQETELATTAERLRGEHQRLQADEGRCRLAAGDCASVASRVRQLDDRLVRARELADAQQEHQDADRRLFDAATVLQEALREAGFASADAARLAQLGASESTALQQRVRTHDANAARVSSGLAEEPIAALSGDEVADVPAALEAHEIRHRELMEASNATATAAIALEQCDRARRALSQVLERHRKLVEDAAPIVRMGELANAGEGNVKSTTLSTFVLLRRFEDVVAVANERLTTMSDGRFSLARTDEREGRARRAGLGLVVVDHHTETNRDPHTLSGGETFYVSLCLALGLADVVTSEAGGIALDTLFIDEGFGSLDPDTLDGVLGELARLQDGGRAVGIVSHVAELKTRIPERIEITRLVEGGSTLLVRT